MKRNTWIMLGVLALLLAVWGIRSQRSAPNTAPPPLDIEGYIGNVSEQDARSQAKDKPAPITRIVIQRADEQFTLERSAESKPAKPVEGDKPAEPMQEAKWKIVRTAHGKSTEAKAQAFRAQSMSETLQRTIRSNYALPVKADQLAEYGLDPAHALDVQLTLPKQTVKLRIGHLDKGQDIDSSTTWVMDPARPDVVYQVVGRDLRTSFDVTWSDLREKGLLALELAAVDRLTIENPADPKAKKVVVQRPPLPPEAKKEPAEGEKKARDANEGWILVEPTGMRVGDVGDWLRAIERLSAEEFLDAAEVAKKGTDTGLQDAATAVRLTIAVGGKNTLITLGKQDEKKRTYVSVEGRDELYLVPSFNRDQVVQTLDQLRDRRLLGATPVKNIQGFTLRGSDGEVEAVRKATKWSLVRPELPAADAAIQDYLKDLEGTKVEFAEPPTPSAVGFDAPVATLTVGLTAGPETIVLGKEIDGNTWGRLTWPDGRVETFKLTSWNAKRLVKKPTDFADRKLVHFDQGAVTELTVTPSEGEAVRLRKDANGVWTLAEQTPANADAVNDLLKSLGSAEWVAQHANKKRATAGLLKDYSALRVKAGTTDLEVRVSQQKNGEDFFASVIGDDHTEQVVSISSPAATSLRKALKDFNK